MTGQKNNAETVVTRRRFLKWGLALCNAAIALVLALPGIGFLLTPLFRKSSSSWVKIGLAGDFTGFDPQKVTFKYISQSGYTEREKIGFAWIVPSSEKKQILFALSAVCSHTGCNVAWKIEQGKFVCPCHDGQYDRQGKVITGPPPRPLRRLPVRVKDGQLFIQVTI